MIGKDNQLEIYVLFFYEKHCVSVCVCMCQSIHCLIDMYVSGIVWLIVCSAISSIKNWGRHTSLDIRRYQYYTGTNEALINWSGQEWVGQQSQ